MDRQLLRPFSPVPFAASRVTLLSVELRSSFHEDRTSDEWTDPSPELDDNWDPRADHGE